jgi:hypothetical protein
MGPCCVFQAGSASTSYVGVTTETCHHARLAFIACPYILNVFFNSATVLLKHTFPLKNSVYKGPGVVAHICNPSYSGGRD